MKRTIGDGTAEDESEMFPSIAVRRLSATLVAIGLDLVTVDEVAYSIQTHGESYLRRVYTDVEIVDCDGRPRALAACFAAKEAALKALKRRDEPVPWTSIAVHRVDGGQLGLTLAGAAAELARVRNVISLELSIAHTSECAAAIVVATSHGS